MNNATQIQEARNQFANEDLAILKEENHMAVTDTNFGVLWLSLENDNFKASNGKGEEIYNTTTEENFKKFLMGAYSVEA